MKATVGYAQFRPEFGAVERNLSEVARLSAEGAEADLLVFPELALTGYEFLDAEEARGLAEVFGEGPTSEAVRGLAAKHSMSIVIGYPERAGDKVFNACMLALPGGGLFNYRKIHLFSRETFIFEPGDSAPPVIETPAGRVGLMICFDWIFPETARLLALAGAQIIAHPSNLVLPYCQRGMFARSVENGVFSITANRIGTEDRAGRSLTFTGGSQVLGPDGAVLAQAPGAEAQVGLAAIDVSRADDKSVNEYNHLMNSRRTDLYGGLLSSREEET